MPIKATDDSEAAEKTLKCKDGRSNTANRRQNSNGDGADARDENSRESTHQRKSVAETPSESDFRIKRDSRMKPVVSNESVMGSRAYPSEKTVKQNSSKTLRHMRSQYIEQHSKQSNLSSSSPRASWNWPGRNAHKTNKVEYHVFRISNTKRLVMRTVGDQSNSQYIRDELGLENLTIFRKREKLRMADFLGCASIAETLTRHHIYGKHLEAICRDYELLTAMPADSSYDTSIHAGISRKTGFGIKELPDRDPNTNNTNIDDIWFTIRNAFAQTDKAEAFRAYVDDDLESMWNLFWEKYPRELIGKLEPTDMLLKMIQVLGLNFQQCETCLSETFLKVCEAKQGRSKKISTQPHKQSSLLQGLADLRRNLFNRLPVLEHDSNRCRNNVFCLIDGRFWHELKALLPAAYDIHHITKDITAAKNDLEDGKSLLNYKASVLAMLQLLQRRDRTDGMLYPLQLALKVGAPLEVINLLINLYPDACIKDWNGGKGPNTPLILARDQGRRKSYKKRDCESIKSKIWSVLPDVGGAYKNLSVACRAGMWEQARLFIIEDEKSRAETQTIGEVNQSTLNTPDKDGIYPFALALEDEIWDKNHNDVTKKLIEALTEEDGEEILRSGTLSEHQLGPWFLRQLCDSKSTSPLSQNKNELKQKSRFDRIVDRFWLILDHFEQAQLQNNTLSSSNTTSRHRKLSKNLKARRNSLARYPSEVSDGIENSRSDKLTIKPQSSLDRRNNALDIIESEPSCRMSASASRAYETHMRKTKDNIQGQFPWGSTLPSRVPALFRPRVIDIAKGEICSLEESSKIIFILYASVFEEVMRIIQNKGIPNPRRLALLGQSVRSGGKCLRDLVNVMSGHQLDSRSAKNAFDIPMGKLSRLIWSGTRKSSMDSTRWFDKIRRKDERLMNAMLRAESECSSMLTTPLGFAMRTGCFHAIRALIKHSVCDPTVPVSFIHLNKNHREDYEPPLIISKMSPYLYSEKKAQHWIPKIRFSLYESIYDQKFYSPHRIHLSSELERGITAYQLAIYQCYREQAQEAHSHWVRVLRLFRENENVCINNSDSACRRTFRCSKGLPEILILLILIIIVTYAYSSLWLGSSSLQFANHMISKLVDEPFDEHHNTFRDVGTQEEFWDWIKSPAFVDELFPAENASDRKINLIVGPIRIRQIRLSPMPCRNSVHTNVELGHCFTLDPENPYLANSLSWRKDTFGPNGKFNWEYNESYGTKIDMESAWLDSHRIMGHSDWQMEYPIHGGYSIYLPVDGTHKLQETIKLLLDEIQTEGFISAMNGTRAVFININFYNPSLDLILAMRLQTEFFPSGGVITSARAVNVMLPHADVFIDIVMILIFILFLQRSYTELSDISWGQLYGFASVLEDTAFGDWAKNTWFRKRRLKSLVSRRTIRARVYRSLKSYFKQVHCLQRRTLCIGCCSDILINLMATLVAEIVSFSCCFGCCGYAGGYFVFRLFILDMSRVTDSTRNPPFFLKMNLMKVCFKRFWQRSCCCCLCICKKFEHKLQRIAPWRDMNMQAKAEPPPSTLTSLINSTRKSQYLKSWWNVYEGILVVLFWLWYQAQSNLSKIRKVAGEKISFTLNHNYHRNFTTFRSLSIIDENHQKELGKLYVDLDEMAWHSKNAYDLSALLFIFVTAHVLKILQQVPWGVGTKVSAITSIFVHPEVVPFYIVLGIGVVAFGLGYYFAFGDSVYDYRNPVQSFRHVLLMTLLGENMPGEDELEEDNITFYYMTLFLVIFVLVLTMLNIFIAVVSEVYAQAKLSADDEFYSILEQDHVEKLDSKLVAQAECLMFPRMHEELRNQIREVDEDTSPSNQADVNHLLMKLDTITSFLKAKFQNDHIQADHERLIGLVNSTNTGFEGEGELKIAEGHVASESEEAVVKAVAEGDDLSQNISLITLEDRLWHLTRIRSRNRSTKYNIVKKIA